MNHKKTISIGVPCFNEELNIPETYKTIKQITEKIKAYNFEYIFVDNGSTDSTKETIKKIALKDKNVIGIFLSRNFGPEASTQALIDNSTGDAFIGIQCDLEDPPSLILHFIDKWEKGYDIVIGIYSKSEDKLLMGLARQLFYKIFKKISNIEVPVNTTGYSLLNRKAINAIKSLPEKYRFTRGLISWIGFKVAYVKYARQKRKYGKSSYNFWRYIKHAERSFFGFSYLPLDIIIYLGFFLVSASFIFIIIYLLIFLFFGNPVKESITIFVSIVLFGGIQLLAISTIGKYIQVIVEETKSRPVYIIEEITNNSKVKSEKNKF
ncbi:MAG: hypothetical protein A2857_01145 [Candidatus Levybacteria bacterium RIFCSPHIGHO2_01_FULL_36_15]|nr:MAG: hypothetical protein A2857_01145 [Candidatus Levybacteria bacterium RIFCSPHIGHO2_01_FULL_36_15]